MSSAIRRRLKLLKRFKTDASFRALTLAACAVDPVIWINDWVWTYDPRRTPSYLPFDLFPRQEEFIRYLEAREANKEHGLAEKSRDVGFTWLCVAFAAHRFCFKKGSKITFGSRKEMLVDRIGDPDSIFEKIRFILRSLPVEMLPAGFNWKLHDNHMRLINPDGGAITGEAGDNMGRGGRSRLYFVDEAAFIERPQKVDAAISNNSDVIIYISTANGTGNPFYQKRMSGAFPVFTFHWRDDPRKDDAWYAKQVAMLDPIIVAQEIDIDYAASIDGIVIPRAFADPALRRALYESETGVKIVGVDVARFGSDTSAVAVREGRNLLHAEEWHGHDLVHTTGRVIALADELERQIDDRQRLLGEQLYLCVDTTGLGAGVADALRDHALRNEKPWVVMDVDAGSKARMVDPKVMRKRDELWWLGRLFFQNEEPAFSSAIADSAKQKLIGELTAPTYRYQNDGSMRVESKDEMKKRGVPSPNLADAFLLTLEVEMQKPVPPKKRDGWRDRMTDTQDWMVT